MITFPKITIVTPSYNQGEFLEETISSVLGQNYPNLEYMIMDGGSDDSSLTIIEKYAEKLYYWVSEKDNGQSSALNKAFEKATGDILMWVNSDDILMPNILNSIVSKTDIEEAVIYFGNCIHFKYQQGLFAMGSDVVSSFNNYELENVDFISQPSSFWTRKAWEITGELREDLHFGFDWEWFLRAKKKGVVFKPIQACLSIYRFHPNHKTSTGSKKRNAELALVYNLYRPGNDILFNSLLSDKQFFSKFFPRVVRKILKQFSKYTEDLQLLKLLKPVTYKHYKLDIMRQVKFMVSNED